MSDDAEGCYICQPDNPHAAEEGCEACERDYWAHVLKPQGVTTREWNVLDNGEPYLQPWTEDEDEARSYSNVVTGPLVYRTRTHFPDYVSQTYEHVDAPEPRLPDPGRGIER